MLKKKMMLMFCILLIPLALAGTVERSFLDNEIEQLETITVSLNVTISGAVVYSIAEFVPEGWTVIDDGTGSLQANGREIRWFVFNPSGNAILEYTAQASVPEGSYLFSGTAQFDDDPIQNISGETQVNVTGVEDTLPPAISNIQSNPSVNSAVVSWTTNENSNSTVRYGTTQALGDVVSTGGFVLSHLVTLSGLNANTTYFYKVESCDLSGNCNSSEIRNFTTLFVADEQEDDLMINYVRGRIIIDGTPAASGTGYRLEVLSGENAGFFYLGTVDSDIPSGLQGNGYFDSLDQIEFDTGETFRVSLLGFQCVNGSAEGVFENGGNGDFETGDGLTEINCTTIQNEPPVLDSIQNQTTAEDNEISITLNASDIDEDELFFDVVSENESEVDCEINADILTFIPAPDWNGEASCEIQVSDGFLTDSQTVNINVLAVNDPPELIGNIAGITWEQDMDLIDFLNLSNYFADVDSVMEFSAVGNQSIGISIEDGMVSFFPGEGFYGIENVVFKANDSEFSVFSNAVILNVTKIGNPPEFGQMNCGLEIEEDIEYVCLLNASDSNNDEFEFNVVNESNLDCVINGSTLRYVSEQDYNGIASCIIRVGDVDGANDFILNVNVLAVNDAPVLDPMPDIIAQEGDLIEIHAGANDVDNDILLFGINDTRFINNGNGNFAWQTTLEDSGVYFFEVFVSDGNGGEDEEVVQILVSNVNEPPVFDVLPEIEILEDSGFQIVIGDLREFATDNDGFIDRFEISSENPNEVDCSIVGSGFAIEPAEDFSGQTNCKIKVFDNNNGFDEAIVSINVLGENDPPVIDSSSPLFNPIITENGMQEFNVVWHDMDNPEDVSVNWFVNGVFASSGDSFLFNATEEGEFDIEAVVNDTIDFVLREWSLTASRIPIVTGYGGGTTNFSGLNEDELMSVELILEKENGKIEFLVPVDLRNDVDFVNFADISHSIVAIDTNVLSALRNVPARITLFNLSFEEMPTIYYDEDFTLSPDEITNVCPLSVCSNRTYNPESGTFVFDVSGFSSFKAGELASCSTLGGNICPANQVCSGELLNSIEGSCCSTVCIDRPLEFRDINRCELEQINQGININIREPDEDDEFEPGEIIDVELRIGNDLDRDLEFDVDVFLYDVSEEDAIEHEDDSLDVDESDSEKIEFKLKVDDDVDDRNDFAIFVKAEDEDGAFCNEESVFIDIERKKHDVVIENFFVPQSAVCGEIINLETNIKNIGSSDEDVYVAIESPELRISERSDIFEIEEFDEDNKKERRFNVKLPDNIEGGVYKIKATVFFDDGGEQYSITKDIILETCRIFREQVEDGGPIVLGGQRSEEQTRSLGIDKSSLTIINTALIIGIIIVLIAIVVARRR